MQIGGVQLKDGAYISGFPKEWAAFEERHGEFLKAFEHLAGTINKVKVRTFTLKAHGSPRNMEDRLTLVEVVSRNPALHRANLPSSPTASSQTQPRSRQLI